MAEYGRLPSDYRKLPSCGQSLVAKSVETGGRVQGVMGVSRDKRSL